MSIMPMPKCSLIHSAITADHLAQLVLLGELSAKGLKISNKCLARVKQSFLWGALAVGLDAEFESGEERVGNCAGSS